MLKEPKVTILHISDLHFGVDLNKTKDKVKKKKRVIKKIKKAAFKGIEKHAPGLSPHDKILCDELATQISSFKEKKCDIDFLIVSGDITALGDTDSFTKVKKYLTSQWEFQNPGLGFDQNNILVNSAQIN